MSTDIRGVQAVKRVQAEVDRNEQRDPGALVGGERSWRVPRGPLVMRGARDVAEERTALIDAEAPPVGNGGKEPHETRGIVVYGGGLRRWGMAGQWLAVFGYGQEYVRRRTCSIGGAGRAWSVAPNLVAALAGRRWQAGRCSKALRSDRDK